jgi:formylglycine-generating enzyme
MSASSIAQDTIVNSAGIRFVKIPAGRFILGEFKPPYPKETKDTLGMMMWMGDNARPYTDAELQKARELAEKDYSDGFEVVIAKSFYLAQTEITQDQWIRVMGNNPSTFKDDTLDKTKYPVESISWKQAKAFVDRLNKSEETKKYRLPSEFEWEYAARGGRLKDIPWSDIQKEAQLGGKRTYAVGLKAANAFGLYDMLGNVWEWVEDCYNEKTFADKRPPVKCDVHVLKGASFAGDVKNATYMTHAAGPGNGWDVGFRILMEIER